MTIFEEMKKDDVNVSLSSDGKLKITGSDETVKKWLPIIAEKKEELIAFLPAWKWRVIFPDGRVIFSHNVPFATRTEVMRLYPDEIQAEAAQLDGAVSLPPSFCTDTGQTT